MRLGCLLLSRPTRSPWSLSRLPRSWRQPSTSQQAAVDEHEDEVHEKDVIAASQSQSMHDALERAQTLRVEAEKEERRQNVTTFDDDDLTKYPYQSYILPFQRTQHYDHICWPDVDIVDRLSNLKNFAKDKRIRGSKYYHKVHINRLRNTYAEWMRCRAKWVFCILFGQLLIYIADTTRIQLR